MSASTVAQMGSKLLTSQMKRQSRPALASAARAQGRCGQVSSPVEIGSGWRLKAVPPREPTQTSRSVVNSVS